MLTNRSNTYAGLILLHAAFLSTAVLLQGCLQPTAVVEAPAAPIDAEVSDPFGFSVSIPPTMPDRAAAFQLAAVALEYSRQIEFDGKQETPVLGTTKDVEERMAKMTRYAYQDRVLATPEFAAVVGAVLEKELDTATEGRELTPELRAKAAEIFRAVSNALRTVK
jgi:hypothetical protein